MRADTYENHSQEGSKTKNFEFFFALLIILITGTLFALGNRYWDERYYTPDEGFGYYLGLVGGSMMLLAFGYTLFKYIPLLRSHLVMKIWLTFHLAFGILGPVLIMFHSTFRIGSVNGGVALIAMIIMFLSGIMARFLYSKTHLTLDGRKARVKEFQEALKLAGRTIKSETLDNFSNSVLSHSDSLPGATWKLISFTWQSRVLYFHLTSDLHRHLLPLAKQQGWNYSTVQGKKREFKRQLKKYMTLLEKVALLDVYIRFFTFWRNAHVPISYLLLMSGVVHVLAVHMY